MDRRALLLGMGAALAAPAIVKAESLMKIAAVRSAASAPRPPQGAIIGLSMNSAPAGSMVNVAMFPGGPHQLVTVRLRARVFAGQVVTSVDVA